MPTEAIPWTAGTEAAAPAVPSTAGTAVLALVCSVLSWTLLPVILAVAALVLARTAEGEINASGGARTGMGLVTASRWIAWINLLLAAMIVAFIAAFALAVAIAR